MVQGLQVMAAGVIRIYKDKCDTRAGDGCRCLRAAELSQLKLSGSCAHQLGQQSRTPLGISEFHDNGTHAKT